MNDEPWFRMSGFAASVPWRGLVEGCREGHFKDFAADSLAFPQDSLAVGTQKFGTR